MTLSEVEELVDGYSVEKMAEKHIKENESNFDNWKEKEHTSIGYKSGFNAHRELMKGKLFTIEDVLVAINLAKNFGKTGDEIIQSLFPKTEWNVTFDEQGKLKLI